MFFDDLTLAIKQAIASEKIKKKMPEAAKMLINTLQKNGHSASRVGGCVRDCIMGREPKDWDICTSATPEEMKEIFKGEKVIETGLLNMR